MGKHLPELVPIIIRYATDADEDDELREFCFQTLESFVLRCPIEITPFIEEITNLSLEYIKYDPNFVEDDNDEEVRMIKHNHQSILMRF